MASKRKTIGGLFEAHKRLTVGPDAPAPAAESADDNGDVGDKEERMRFSGEVRRGEPSPTHQRENQSSACAATVGVTQEQRIRMELNRASAHATRNLRLCESKVAQASAEGLRFPYLEDLLVEKSWLDAMGGELLKPYMQQMHAFLHEEMVGRASIYPPATKVFGAFNSCPIDKVKVVILGQDPYHGRGQAMGLCFSVEKGIKFPSSLLNIFKEIRDDVGGSVPSHGNLEKWAHQGVLLLNTVLTVREGQANSHAKKGWEAFTDAAIEAVAKQRSGIVFLLWGNSAQEKIRLINGSKHHILKAAHPSGLSAHRGFFKCRHFSQTNKILAQQGFLPVDWQI